MIYLDNSATTKPFAAVSERIHECEQIFWHNPSATYAPSLEAKRLLSSARRTVAMSLGASPSEILFTASGTEGDNLAVFGGNKNKKGKLFCSAYEHPAVYECFASLKNAGQNVTFAPINDFAEVDAEALLAEVNADTSLVSIMHVHNETGGVNDVALLCKEVKRRAPNAIFHVDGVQAYGKLPVDLHATAIDLYTVSAHKIHGGRGVGALYIKNGVHLKPLLFGGGQESGLRPGTENLPAVAGFALAAEQIDFDKMKQVRALKLGFLQRVLTKIPDLFIYGDPERGAPHILMLGIGGVKAEILQQLLSDVGVYVGRGSACSAHAKISRTQQALRVPKRYAEGTIRVSLSVETTPSDCEKAADILAEKVQMLRGGKEMKGE